MVLLSLFFTKRRHYFGFYCLLQSIDMKWYFWAFFTKRRHYFGFTVCFHCQDFGHFLFKKTLALKSKKEVQCNMNKIKKFFHEHNEFYLHLSSSQRSQICNKRFLISKNNLLSLNSQCPKSRWIIAPIKCFSFCYKQPHGHRCGASPVHLHWLPSPLVCHRSGLIRQCDHKQVSRPWSG